MSDESTSLGAIVVSGGGRVLLRAVPREAAGAGWALPSVQPVAGEAADAAAVRAVREQTGYDACVLAPLAGELSRAGARQFLLMDAAHPPQNFGTTPRNDVRWVEFDEAIRLVAAGIGGSAQGGDGAALEAAEFAARVLPRSRAPRVHPEDAPFPLQAMPALHGTLWFGRRYDAAAMDAIRRGYVTPDADSRWFMYFSGSSLRIHRSWSGALVYDVAFEPTADGGARIAHVIFTRDRAQFEQPADGSIGTFVAQVIEEHLLQG